MPQKNAFIIDGDREFAKRVAAALRDDALKVGIAEGDRDPLEQLINERPDVVIMRADARDGESGFALCTRLKKNRRLAGLGVVLYSAEVDEQTFEHHRQQEGAADGYFHFPTEPPYEMDDLRARVMDLLFNEEAERPPPLPASEEPVKPITDEDNAFLDRVLDSLQQTSIEEEASTIPPLRTSNITRRTTADAKLDMLRQKLRQREFELAKVMEMYRAKEREYHEWNEKLVEKDVEAQALKVTIEDHQRAAQKATTELDRRTTEFNASFEQMLEEKVSRENELINAVAHKEKELSEALEQLGQARLEGERLKTELEHAQASAEAAAEAHRKALAELRAELQERESTLASVEQALADAHDRIAELEVHTSNQESSLGERTEEILELQACVLALRGDLGDARELYDEAVAQHRFELRAHDEIIDGLRGDLDEAEISYAQLEGDLRRTVATLTEELDARAERLRAGISAQHELESAFKAVQLRETAKEAELNQRIVQLSEGLQAERANRVEAEAQFDAELDQAQRKIAGLQDSIADLEVVSGERLRVLAEQVEERDGQITQLKETVDDLETRRRGLQTEVDQRLAELAESEAAQTEALAERDTERARLMDELQTAQGEMRTLRDEIASLHAEIAELQSHLEDIEQEKAATESEFARQYQTQSQTLASTLETAETQQAHLRSKLSDLNDMLAERAETLKSVQESLAEANASLKERDDTIHSLRETIASREGRLVELQEGFRKEQSGRQALDAQLTQLRIEHDGRNEKIGRLEAQVAAQEEAIKALRADNAQLHVDRDSAREALTELRAELAASNSSIEERSARLSESTKRLQDREGEVTGLRAQIAELNSLRERAFEAKLQLQQQLEDARREWTVVREELVADRHQLKERIGGLEEELKTVHGIRESLNAEVERLKQDGQAAVRTQEDLQVDLDARQAHAQAIERELHNERAQRVTAEEMVERMQSELSDLTNSAKTASETSISRLQELEGQLAQMSATRDATLSELEQARSEVVQLTDQVNAISADKDGLTQRFGTEASTLSRRLDDAMTRSAVLASEKANVEQQRIADIRKLEQQLGERNATLAEQKAEVARLTDAVARLNGELAEVRKDRDEVETKYVRELEDAHEEYMKKAQQTDTEHAREVENLRKAAIDAKRQLKTAQLASNRLEERVRRLEAERPSRSDASADFESFIAQFSDSSSGGGARPASTRPTPVPNVPSPSAPVPVTRAPSSSPARPAVGRPTRPEAQALTSSAAPRNVPDGEEEITEVGARPALTAPTIGQREKSGLPVPSRLRGKSRPEEPDDFLAAFDKEFEDIKGG